ncbi:MAG: ubiquinol-cytochrome C chaperone family protein [Alphaproteobacteria bacterium]|jgi:cytochrome b pre-mRNA-processing protein 3|nr:ubiquinol-cytochrome C chaperone family protein [Alphaproteobacteria bacterium]MDP6872201.1 ubiquinol-cytochrome C chaperone family protein [Alphaproteobacteria bacterium]
MLKNWFRRDREGEDVAHALYLAAVAQARQPLFYAEHGVPDSVDGRFDLIVMHVFLLLRPLHETAQRKDDPALAARAGTIAQALFDTMFADMDRSLREMGVSDIAVGKRVKQMAKAFYGRVEAYEEGLAGTDTLLGEALRRNLFGTVVPGAEHLSAMTDYLRAQARHLTGIGADQAISGEMQFAPWSGKSVDP